MKYIIFVSIILSLSFPLSGNGITEYLNTNETAQLNEGVNAYKSGDIQKAINFFYEAASSSNPEIASSAYYNHGTALAKAAESTKDQKEFLSMMEKAYQSIKRSFLLDALSKEEKINAQRNMQIIREKLLQSQNLNNQSKQDNKSDNNEESENSESGNSSEDKTDSDKDEQNNNESDESSHKNTNGQQNNDDNEKDADKPESAAEEIDEEKEMNDILDQETDNKQIRQILESKGGIYNVDKNW